MQTIQRSTALIAAFGLTASIGTAGDFGSADEARTIGMMLADIVAEGGVDAGISAMHDPSLPFSSSSLGIHLFEAGIIVGDNREPELIASSYEEVQDLTGEPMWPRIVDAADQNGEAVLEWYHYDTEAEYSYNCFSTWAEADTALVMVCR